MAKHKPAHLAALDQAALFRRLENDDEIGALHIGRYLRDCLHASPNESWLISALVDYYVASGSTRTLDIILSCSELNVKHLQQRLFELLRPGNSGDNACASQTIVPTLTLLANIVYASPGWLPSLLRPVPTLVYKLNTIVQCMDDQTVQVSCALLLTSLIRLLPGHVISELKQLFNSLRCMFDMLICQTADMHCDSLPPSLQHSHSAVRTLFVCLYAHYPRQTFEFLRALCEHSDAGAPIAPLRTKLVLALVQQVRVSPLLLTNSSSTFSTCRSVDHVSGAGESCGALQAEFGSAVCAYVAPECTDVDNCVFCQSALSSDASVTVQGSIGDEFCECSAADWAWSPRDELALTSGAGQNVQSSQGEESFSSRHVTNSNSVPSSPRKRLMSHFGFGGDKTSQAAPVSSSSASFLTSRLSSALQDRHNNSGGQIVMDSDGHGDRVVDTSGADSRATRSTSVAPRRKTADSAIRQVVAKFQRERHSSHFDYVGDETGAGSVKNGAAAGGGESGAAIATLPVNIPTCVTSSSSSTLAAAAAVAVSCASIGSVSTELAQSAGSALSPGLLASAASRCRPGLPDELVVCDSHSTEQDDSSSATTVSSLNGHAVLATSAPARRHSGALFTLDDCQTSALYTGRDIVGSCPPVSLLSRRCRLASYPGLRTTGPLRPPRLSALPTPVVGKLRAARGGFSGQERASVATQTDNTGAVAPCQHLLQHWRNRHCPDDQAQNNTPGVCSSAYACSKDNINDVTLCSDVTSPNSRLSLAEQLLLFERHERHLYMRRCCRLYDRWRQLRRYQQLNQQLTAQVANLSMDVSECQRQAQLARVRHNRHTAQQQQLIVQLETAASSAASSCRLSSQQLTAERASCQQLRQQLGTAEQQLEQLRSQLVDAESRCADRQQQAAVGRQLRARCDDLERQLLERLSGLAGDNSRSCCARRLAEYKTSQALNNTYVSDMSNPAEHSQKEPATPPTMNTMQVQRSPIDGATCGAAVVTSLQRQLKQRDQQLQRQNQLIERLKAQLSSQTKFSDERYSAVKSQLATLERFALDSAARLTASGDSIKVSQPTTTPGADARKISQSTVDNVAISEIMFDPRLSNK